MSIKNLMHSLIGASSQGSALQNSAAGTTAAQNIQHSVLSQMGTTQRKHSHNKKVFHGNIEVLQVANGYVVSIGTREGYEYETHIASTIGEVNEIIAAQIVAFKLEDKS